MLLLLGYIGIPYVFAANYSLLHRLLKRPGEEQERLLSKPIIIVPDPWQSDDWQKTLEAQRNVAPKVLKFDPFKDAQNLHRLSAGRKRAAARLFLHAFRAEYPRGGIVDLAAIERAYHSPQYAVDRTETEAIITQTIQNRPVKGRNDLWCPLPLPKDKANEYLENAATARQEMVAEQELRAALTKGERLAAQSIEKASRKKQPKTAGVLQFPKAGKATGDELLANAALFREKL